MRNIFRWLSILLLVGITVAQTPAKNTKTHTKISKEVATKTALARVPNGTVKETELEKEKGKWVWSVDIATPGSKDITEVQVDADTGEVVSVEKETPKIEAAEKKKEAKH